jgi:hypothetical protein
MSFLYINPGYASMCKTYNAVQSTDTNLNKNFSGACIGVSSSVSVATLTDLPPGTKDVYMVGDWKQQSHSNVLWHNYLYLLVGGKTVTIDINTYKIYKSDGITGITASGNHNIYNHFSFEFHSNTDSSKAILKWTEDGVVIYNDTIDWLQTGADITQISLGDGDKNQLFCNLIISDQPIKPNLQIVELTTTESESTMTKSGNVYTATTAGQYVTDSISAGSLTNGTICGIFMTANNAYYDGEGLTKLKCECLNGNDVIQSEIKSLIDKNTTTNKSETSNFWCNIPVEKISSYKVKYTAET